MLNCLQNVMHLSLILSFLLNTAATALKAADQFKIGTTGVIQLDDVNCSGSEPQLLDCPRALDREIACDHTEDAAVKCFPRKKKDHAYLRATDQSPSCTHMIKQLLSILI